MNGWERISGGATAPQGYQAHGVHAGIKPEKPDMALLVSEDTAVIAGAFTTNQVQGAHVGLCRDRLAGRQARAIIINSGNANACTGGQGVDDAREMAAATAEPLGCEAELVFACSTGGVGIPLPMDTIRAGIEELVAGLCVDGADAAALGIMTTDTVPKQAAVELELDGKTVRIGAMAKGAGMVEPNMATMLAFLTTDAAVDPDALQACLSDAVAQSFNRISIDGNQSCNDTVLLMANGRAGNELLQEGGPGWNVFCGALNAMTLELAHRMVADGEGASKFVTIEVSGADSDSDAEKAARAIANSALVKSAFYGEVPGTIWGRMLVSMGYSGAEIDASLVDISYDDVPVVHGGKPLAQDEKIAAIVQKPSYGIRCDLHLGEGAFIVYTCDYTEDYVTLNK
jgi:glutamate N-acetyltransferase/amino-acid N-acetyltransferase